MADRKQIGICITGLQHKRQSDIINAIVDEAKNKEVSVHIFAPFSDLADGSRGKKSQKDIFKFIKYNHIDVLVVFEDFIRDENEVKILTTYASLMDIPVIEVNSSSNENCRIQYDAAPAYIEIVDDLVKNHNATCLDFLGYNDGSKMSSVAKEAFKEALSKNEMELDVERIGLIDRNENSVAVYLTDYINSGKTLPHAFICSDDEIAAKVCDFLIKLDVKIPEQVKVAGMGGNLDMEHFAPKITTAVFDATKFATLLVDTFEKLVNKEIEKDTELKLEGEVVFAESTGHVESAGEANDSNEGGSDKGEAEIKKLQDKLSEAMKELSIEREFFLDMIQFVNGVNDKCNIGTLIDLLPQYASKVGISAYNIYIKTEYAAKAGVNAENIDNSVPLLWLSNFKENENTKLMFSLDWDRFHKSRNMLRTDSYQLVSIPLTSEETFYGFMTFAYHSDKINRILLNELSEGINSALDKIFF